MAFFFLLRSYFVLFLFFLVLSFCISSPHTFLQHALLFIDIVFAWAFLFLHVSFGQLDSFLFFFAVEQTLVIVLLLYNFIYLFTFLFTVRFVLVMLCFSHFLAAFAHTHTYMHGLLFYAHIALPSLCALCRIVRTRARLAARAVGGDTRTKRRQDGFLVEQTGSADACRWLCTGYLPAVSTLFLPSAGLGRRRPWSWIGALPPTCDTTISLFRTWFLFAYLLYSSLCSDAATHCA